MKSVYDCIIVGASPVCLIEGYFRSLAGEKVAIIERKGHIGGAWSLIDSEDFRDVEYGTHIFFPPLDEVHRFMQEYLDWELNPMEPVPEIRVRGKKLRLAPHNEVLAKNLKYWDIFRSGKGLKGKKGNWFATWYDRNFRPLRSFFKGMVKYLKLPKDYPDYMYIEGGAPAMLDLFEKQVSESGLEIMLNRELDQIDVRKEEGRVLLKSGEGSLETRELVMTTCSTTPDFRIDGEAIPLPNEERFVNHLHLYLSDSEARRFSYLVFEGHRFLRRVSDVTRFAQPLTDDSAKKAICVWLRSRIEVERTQQGAKEVLDELVELGYFPSTVKMESFEWSCYGGTFQEDKTLQHIAELGGALVKTFSSGNLVASLLPHMGRWKRLQEQANVSKKEQEELLMK